MTNAVDHLKILSFDNIKWITDLKNKICLNGTYTDEDIKNAVSNFLSIEIPETITSQITSTPREDKKKLIYKLYENKNIGGLINDQVIEFSPFFTLIYGKNGSGKSSYYKILKNIFLEAQNLKSNIYSSADTMMTAKIDLITENQFKKYQRKGHNDFPQSVQEISWSPNEHIPSKVKFCDSIILNESLSKKETGWSVDRYKLDYYEIFREAIDAVEKEISLEINKLNAEATSLLSILNRNLKSREDTSIYIKLNNTQSINSELNRLIEHEIIPSKIEEKKEELNVLVNQNAKDISDSITINNTKIDLYTSYVQYLNEKISIYEELNNVEKVVVQLIKLKNKRDYSLFDKYDLLFSLENEYKDIYIELLKSVVKTAQKYEIDNYPIGIEKCFYCNQDLPDENKNLIQKIHQTIDDEIEVNIQSIQKTIDHLILKIEKFIEKTIGVYSTITVLESSSLEFKKLNNFNSILDNNILRSFILYLKSLDLANTVSYKNEIYQLKNHKELVESNIKIFKLEVITYQTQLSNLEIIKSQAKRELASVLDEEYCFVNKESIIKLRDITSGISQYTLQSSNFTSYKSKLSKDKSKVEEELLRRNYIDRFNAHLVDFKLPNREKINRKFSVSSGQTKIEGNITGNSTEYKIDDILSEGEAKVYSLCDWFTELEFDDINTIVFDDPITSLDHNNIAKLAKKICSLANTYQVIIFTHNMEFYKYLVDYSLGNNALENKTCKICKDLEGQFQCEGFKSNENKVYKCGNYLKVEYFVQPGSVEKGINYNTLNYINKLLLIKTRIEIRDMSNVVVNLRSVINDFIEQYRFNNIKRNIYKGEDLIHFEIRDISNDSLSSLQQLHHTLSSSSGLLHSQDDEITTELDASDYIHIYNQIIDIVNIEARQNLQKI
jgi:energy-coupling factor transporter ATP-binding protein EcfA2